LHSSQHPLSDETGRLAALESYGILDSAAERAYDDITLLARDLIGTPMALITLLDDKRQWFKSRLGVDIQQTPREISFCHVAIQGEDVLVVEDLQCDPRFAGNPMVAGAPGLRFYAGAPLISPDGFALGTLCVMDHVPRQLDEAQGRALQVLSRQVVSLLELRRSNAALGAAMRSLELDRDQLRSTQLALQQEQQLSKQVVNSSPIGICLFDASGQCVIANPAAGRQIGATPEQLRAQNFHQIESWRHFGLYELAQKTLRSGQPQTTVVNIETTFGRKAWLGVNFVALSAGEARWLMVMTNDMSDFRLAEQQRREALDSYKLLFTNSMDGVLQAEPGGQILAANPAACELLCLSEAELRMGDSMRIIDPADLRLGPMLDERQRLGRVRGELTMVRGNGEHFEAEVSSALYKNAQGQTLSSLVFRDITTRKQAEAHIHWQAYFDALTGLPNRRMLLDRIEHDLALARRLGQIGALLFVDLDHFKHINDALGHSTGDKLLKQVAQRFKHLLRDEDTVARLGGDEFVVLLCHLGTDGEVSALHAMTVAEKIRAELERGYDIDNHTYNISGSIGITLFPKRDEVVDDLLREADTAMYRAKSAGRNRIAFFEASMHAEVQDRLALEQDLKRAIGSDELSVHVQAQFNTAGQEVGAELLLRWQHPQRGPVSPLQFIPVAEDSGLILELGDFVLRQACEALAKLRRAGHALPLSVNVSPRQFHSDTFISRLQALLQETGAPAQGLILEVTEGLLIDKVDDTVARMTELVSTGIRFSIDDFGTGYSSLAYLKMLPLYELKIDKSFVQDAPHDASDGAIVEAILAMATHMKLHVVAEGVEKVTQADFLAQRGCECMQGYLFARPAPLAVWLAARLK
jgi:diguanylate cyclase (GGDEF)-like protein/PAS domain S-box-containing protein